MVVSTSYRGKFRFREVRWLAQSDTASQPSNISQAMYWVGRGIAAVWVKISQTANLQSLSSTLHHLLPEKNGDQVQEFQAWEKMMSYGGYPLTMRFFIVFIICLLTNQRVIWHKFWVQAPTTFWMPWTATLCNQMGPKAQGSWDSLSLRCIQPGCKEKQRGEGKGERKGGGSERERENWLLGLGFQTLLPVCPKGSPHSVPPKDRFEPRKNPFYWSWFKFSFCNWKPKCPDEHICLTLVSVHFSIPGPVAFACLGPQICFMSGYGYRLWSRKE